MVALGPKSIGITAGHTQDGSSAGLQTFEKMHPEARNACSSSCGSMPLSISNILVPFFWHLFVRKLQTEPGLSFDDKPDVIGVSMSGIRLKDDQN